MLKQNQVFFWSLVFNIVLSESLDDIDLKNSHVRTIDYEGIGRIKIINTNGSGPVPLDETIINFIKEQQALLKKQKASQNQNSNNKCDKNIHKIFKIK